MRISQTSVWGLGIRVSGLGFKVYRVRVENRGRTGKEVWDGGRGGGKQMKAMGKARGVLGPLRRGGGVKAMGAVWGTNKDK